ncbi:MAG: hypothetical protein ACFE95_08900 [Candidatus Hodarchaeota archaeon]
MPDWIRREVLIRIDVQLVDEGFFPKIIFNYLIGYPRIGKSLSLNGELNGEFQFVEL